MIAKGLLWLPALLLATSGADGAAPPAPLVLRLEVGPSQVLVGEPVSVALTGQNVTRTVVILPTVIAWGSRFASLDLLEAPPGAYPPGDGLLGHRLYSFNAPIWSTKTALSPGEEVALEPFTIQASYPGRHTLVYRYVVRPEDLISERLPSGEVTANGEVWTGQLESCPGTWEVLAPEGVDAEAMSAYLADVPGAQPRFILDVWRQQILSRFPTSTYAGYSLAGGALAFPYDRALGDWKDRLDFVARIGGGSFLKDHPEVSVFLEEPQVVEGVLRKTTRVESEPMIRRHRRVVEEFLALHPGFALRGKLESMLALDCLALVDAGAARAHWEWTAQSGSDSGLAKQASEYLRALDESGLLGPAGP